MWKWYSSGGIVVLFVVVVSSRSSGSSSSGGASSGGYSTKLYNLMKPYRMNTIVVCVNPVHIEEYLSVCIFFLTPNLYC